MALIFGNIKCYFCGNTGGLFHSVHDYGIYGDIGKRIFYHPECMEMVQLDPEKFAHIWMDKAIHIEGLRKSNIATYNSKIISEFKKKVEKLHISHFERMMPK
jgi:hypothetical protein